MLEHLDAQGSYRPMHQPEAQAGLEISLLGGFLLRRDTGEVIELSGQKDRALLGFLAVSPGVPYAREKLAALLWGGSTEKQARDSLKQALLRLRRSFSAISPMPLITKRQSVMIDADSVTVDVEAFELLLSDGAPESIAAAIALYRGDLLDGIQVRDAAFEDWLLVERQRLHQLVAEASTRLMNRSLATGNRALAGGAAQRLLSLDPLHEAACRVLMQVHADRGERAQALRLFEALRDRLQKELSVMPESQTVELYKLIRRRDAAASPAPSFDDDLADGDRQPAMTWSAEREDDAPAEGPSDRSIAVLPFTNIGNDPEQDYFADGLTEDIITDLSQVSALFVAARHTVMAFKGSALPAQQAAQRLNVKYLLEGSVRKAEGRIRVTAQLIDGTTGGHVWANRYDRGLDDVFAVQDEIAESIVDVLKVKLLPEERESIASHSTTDVGAYQYYLMGRSFYLRGIDRHSLRIAREMFLKAIEIDPNYALAHAALAICQSYLSMSISMTDPEAGFEVCLEHSERALDLDPALAEAHAGKGLALYAAGRYQEAAPEFERAIELDPELFEAQFFFARNCHALGLRQEAADLFERAAHLRPNDFRSLGLLSEEYQALGRHDDFLAAARRCLERVEAEIEAHPGNAGALAFGSAVLADLGQQERAVDWATRAVMIGPDDCMARYNVARAYAILGQPDRALDHLEQAFACSPVWQRRLARWMRQDEDMDPLRKEPRFTSLMTRLEAELGVEL